MNVRHILLAVLLFSAARPAAADDDCQRPSEGCVAVGRWNFSLALGAGFRTNPLANSQGLPLVIVPQFSYYGKRFFIDDLDFGVTLAESHSNTLSLIASPGYDRVFFYRSDLQNILVNIAAAGTGGSGTTEPFPARSRRVTYLAGPEWTFEFHGISGQIDVLQEATGQSGEEVRAALAIPLLESVGRLTANTGLTWKSAAIVNYYYGAPGIYTAGSAFDPFFKLGYTLPLGGKWRFNAFMEYERLASAIADSPIVAEHHVATMFVGAIYSF